MPAPRFREEIKPLFENLKSEGHTIKENNRIRYVDEDCIIIWFTVREHSTSNALMITTDDNNRDQLSKAIDEAKSKKRKFFCCAVYDTATKNKYPEMEDYIISIECFDYFLRPGCSTLSLSSKWEEIKNNEKDIFRFNYNDQLSVAVIKKDKFGEYIAYFDNRPYLTEGADTKKHIVFEPVEVLKDKTLKKINDWPLNLLVYGAPGTGKSNMLNEEIKNNKINKENYRRVTFYEDYTYSQFVGTYKPIPKDTCEQISIEGFNKDINGEICGEHVTYEFVPGVFSEILLKAYISALKNEKEVESYILIIEELNRANAASVFGDIFQLLDRDDTGISKYEIRPSKEFLIWFNSAIRNEIDLEEDITTIQLLPNILIWATMNSADQGVYPLDSAFKRRWGYIYKDINSSRPAKLDLFSVEGTNDIVSYSWDEFRNGINCIIETYFDEDRCIGPWYFSDNELNDISKYFYAVKNDGNLNNLVNPLVDKLLSYLRQDVFRNNPKDFFYDDYLSMSKIRKAINEKTSLLKIIKMTSTDFVAFKENSENE